MTRTPRTFALTFLALAAAALPAHGQAVVDPHIRSDDPEIRSALAHGVNVSPTLQHLVDTINASDVVVYIAFDGNRSPSLAGHLSFISAVRGRRYLRVSIDPRLADTQRIAVLGHELEHAVEVAESRRVTDETTLAELYQRIGFRSSGLSRECYDSASAILAGRMVEKEANDAKREAELTGRHGSFDHR